jgi:pimeloyl-ACP methyl ester carboxylesterase
MFAPWEERYVVVQWDQRGSGKTFEKLGQSTPNMTLEQLTADTIEVARYVLQKLGRRGLVLVGHSWGSMLGIRAARAHPELFHAFVGTGQVVNGRQILEEMRSSAVKRAQAANDAQAASALSALSVADLGDMTRLPLVFKWTRPFEGSDYAYLELEYGHKGPAADQWFAGLQFSLSRLMPSLVDFDARNGGRELHLPYFVIQGSHDPRTPPSAASSFVNWVHAPAKGYTEIEGGHFACFTNSRGFLAALDQDLRLATRRSS